MCLNQMYVFFSTNIIIYHNVKICQFYLICLKKIPISLSCALNLVLISNY